MVTSTFIVDLSNEMCVSFECVSLYVVVLQKGLLPPPPGAGSRGRSAPPRPAFSPPKPAMPFDLSAVVADFEPKPASLVDNLPDPPVSRMLS